MPQKPPDDGKRKVKDGEWVGSIAAQYGYTNWEHDLWQRPENAELREAHPDPHLLAPGDILFVPPWDDKQADAATAQRHRFKLKAPTEVFRLRLLDERQKPLKNEEYVLTLRYDPGGGSYEQANERTDGDGQLVETVPSTTTIGILKLPRLNQSIRLRFGFLTPMGPDEKHKWRGAKQRLLSLGFNPGPIDDEDSSTAKGAVKSFQQFCKDQLKKNNPDVLDPGPVDGTLGDQTLAALTKYYGS
jgi:hypothetical protein